MKSQSIVRVRTIIFTVAAVALGPLLALADEGGERTTVCYRLSDPQVETCKALEPVSYFTSPSPIFEQVVGDKAVRLQCWYHYSVIGSLLPRRLVAILDVTDRKAGVHESGMGETITEIGTCSVTNADGRTAKCCLGPGD